MRTSLKKKTTSLLPGQLRSTQGCIEYEKTEAFGIRFALHFLSSPDLQSSDFHLLPNLKKLFLKRASSPMKKSRDL
ncbi:hypothetical protein TNCV_3529741 [Trichonephila clavipes]|uniref:Uncharacterized protein n=1 Tax=Trichonephila clavipes TaxID=2585209 RepID=A0A8X6RBU2_TRICX|nr:hypothetical protein TNCV_3529741 [Trichonephila clavipes]